MAAIVIGVVILGIGSEARHRPLRPFAKRIAREQHLSDDLARGEVADEPHRTGVAETAVERAADLARHAQGSPVGVGDKDHLIFLAVGGGEQPFARAVARHLRLAHGRAADDEAVGQPGRMAFAISVIASKSVTPR